VSNLFLDSFQLIVAVYLLYLAIKGKGNMYRFFDIPQSEQPRIQKLLRAAYLTGGLLALSDAGLNMLQNTMYTQQVTESGEEIIQNFTVGALPFISYDFLSYASSVLTLLIVLVLAGTFIYLRRVSRKNADVSRSK
jgi:threonine/homoserine/homoserine lactone efflux protein